MLATGKTTTTETATIGPAQRKGGVKTKYANNGMNPATVPRKILGSKKGKKNVVLPSNVSVHSRGKTAHVYGGKVPTQRKTRRQRPGVAAAKRVKKMQQNFHKDGTIFAHVQIARIAKHVADGVATRCTDFKRSKFMMNTRALRILEEYIKYQAKMRCYQALVIAKTAKRMTVYQSDHQAVRHLLDNGCGQYHVPW